MKKTIVILVAFLLLLSLTACFGLPNNFQKPAATEWGALSPQTERPVPRETEERQEPAQTADIPFLPLPTETAAPTTEEPTTEEPTTEAPPELLIPFYSYSDSTPDGKGYQLDRVLTVSPWISQNETELLAEAWSKVSRGKSFPSLGEMGITKNYVVSGFGQNYIEYDEVFFAVGSIEIYNRTEGFPISAEDPNSVYVSLSGANRFNTMTVLFGNGSRTYYSVAGGVFGTQGGGWSPMIAKMQSDHWGPVPIVLAQAVDKTPNHPQGDPACTDVSFRFGSDSFTLPLLSYEDALNGAQTGPGPEDEDVWMGSVEFDDFEQYTGMTRQDLVEYYGDPDSDDGAAMVYDKVSWHDWVGNFRFFFENSSAGCKTNCASWTTDGSEAAFAELCEALEAEGTLVDTAYPKDGQIEKSYNVNGMELTAGYENSAAGTWTYLFAVYPTD